MRTRRRTWEIGHTTCYRQWNHTRARRVDKLQRTTNHIALPILQVNSLISNDVFNTDAHHQWRYTSYKIDEEF